MTLPLCTAAFTAWRAVNALRPSIEPGPEVADAIVKLSIKAVDGARTADTLGAEREGTGILIDRDGLILTIGYLVIEAGSVLAVTADGRLFPATVVGFDHATGFGLVRADRRVTRNPVELGDSDRLLETHPVAVAAPEGYGGISGASVVSRRRFAGYWEYMIDGAIFTAPPRYGHSGAALLDSGCRLVGTGSLWVADALESDAAFPGNMFVPVNLLKPILDELLRFGRRGGPGRPCLGIYTESVKGHLVVTRVLPAGPAESAGMRRGDIILGVGGKAIGSQTEFYDLLWTEGTAGTAISLHVLRSNVVRSVTVHSIERTQYFTGSRDA